jgi:hypothetical protein
MGSLRCYKLELDLLAAYKLVGSAFSSTYDTLLKREFRLDPELMC